MLRSTTLSTSQGSVDFSSVLGAALIFYMLLVLSLFDLAIAAVLNSEAIMRQINAAAAGDI